MKFTKEHIHIYDPKYNDLGILTFLENEGTLLPIIILDDYSMGYKIKDIEDCREVFKLFIEKYNGDNNEKKKK